jgi:hypothetical protein
MAKDDNDHTAKERRRVHDRWLSSREDWLNSRSPNDVVSNHDLARRIARELSRNQKPPPPAATNDSVEPVGPVDTPAWITAHLKQMIERNKIPEGGVRIGKLSELLEADMLTAKETNKWLKPVTAHYIRNHLRDWVAAAKIAIKIL